MPRRDGTGPTGQGPMTGRGGGTCSSDTLPLYQRGCGRSFARVYNCRIINNNGYTNNLEALTEQKETLEARLDIINKQLNNKR